MRTNMNPKNASKLYRVGDKLVGIFHDDDPVNPREFFDGESVMLCWTDRYHLGDDNESLKQTYHRRNYGYDWSAVEEAIVEGENPLAILPLYLFDHSGIRMRTGSFHDPWDSRQVGFIWFVRDKAHYLTPEDGKSIEEIAKEDLERSVVAYSNYICGDTYLAAKFDILADGSIEFSDDQPPISGYSYSEEKLMLKNMLGDDADKAIEVDPKQIRSTTSYYIRA